MSQSPSHAASVSEALNYLEASNQLTRLIKTGKSFSGHERNCCFLNTGAAKLANISAVSGLDFEDDGRCVSLVDWDGDGDLDLWLTNRTCPQVRFMRNNVDTANGWLSLRLQGNGTTTNRDAIGARVEVVTKGVERRAKGLGRGRKRIGNGEKLEGSDSPKDKSRNLKSVKSLRAGAGFLSQSSKWIHFGLGPAAQIRHVVVNWPGGDTETFHGVSANGRFRLVQSTGNAELWPANARQINLKPSHLDKLTPTAKANIWLASRTSLPRIRYQTLDGTEQSLERLAGRPLLLNLWATWCPPCLAELRQFAAHQQQLGDAGLQILALCVDQLGDERGGDKEKIAAFLNRIKHPFQAGIALGESVDKLELLYLELFSRRVSLPVPASFLIDAEGRLAAIYLGRVEVDRLLNDVNHLSVADSERLRLAIPFPGRWHRRPGRPDRRDLAAAYTRAGYTEDSIPLYRTILAADPQNVEALNLLGASLAIQGDDPTAIRRYRQAVQVNPDYVLAQYNLALALARQGQTDEAVERFGIAVELSPNYADAHLRLADILETQGRISAATTHFQHATRLNPRQFISQRRLGRILARQNLLEEAAEHLRLALDIDPQHAATHGDLGIVRGRLGDMAAAVEHLRVSVTLTPNGPMTRLNLAAALMSLGDDAEAVDHYRRAIQLQPDSPAPASGLAWVLATSSDDAVRDPAEALRLAESVRAAGGDTYQALKILAAAHAAAGQYDKAVSASEQAIKLAQNQGRTEAMESLQQQLLLFQAGKPYRR